MPYQRFGGEPSDSNSEAKLIAIQLPESLEGKSVLDIGCNEGFFCATALKRGASKVVGIDRDPNILVRAKLRTPGAVFMETSWWDVPTDRYDYILFLSAMHYEPRPQQLFRKLYDYLTPTGTLILECGALPDFSSKRWSIIERHDGILRYPSFRLLVEDLLDSYAVRDIGASVLQPGDPVPRYVFHCRRFIPTVIVITGKSNAGKTVLSREFAKAGGHVVHLDFFFAELYRQNRLGRNPALQYFVENFDTRSVDNFLRKAREDNKVELVSQLVEMAISPDERLTIIEGYQFVLQEYLQEFTRNLKARGYSVHVLNI